MNSQQNFQEYLQKYKNLVIGLDEAIGVVGVFEASTYHRNAVRHGRLRGQEMYDALANPKVLGQRLLMRNVSMLQAVEYVLDTQSSRVGASHYLLESYNELTNSVNDWQTTLEKLQGELIQLEKIRENPGKAQALCACAKRPLEKAKAAPQKKVDYISRLEASVERYEQLLDSNALKTKHKALKNHIDELGRLESHFCTDVAAILFGHREPSKKTVGHAQAVLTQCRELGVGLMSTTHVVTRFGYEPTYWQGSACLNEFSSKKFTVGELERAAIRYRQKVNAHWRRPVVSDLLTAKSRLTDVMHFQMLSLFVQLGVFNAQLDNAQQSPSIKIDRARFRAACASRKEDLSDTESVAKALSDAVSKVSGVDGKLGVLRETAADRQRQCSQVKQLYDLVIAVERAKNYIANYQRHLVVANKNAPNGGAEEKLQLMSGWMEILNGQASSEKKLTTLQTKIRDDSSNVACVRHHFKQFANVLLRLIASALVVPLLSKGFRAGFWTQGANMVHDVSKVLDGVGISAAAA